MNSRKLFYLAAVSTLLVGLLPAAVAGQEKPVPASLPKIEAALIKILATEGKSDLIVAMARHADLSAAYEMGDWSARGKYVYEALRTAAERSQAPLAAYLDDMGLKHKTFIAGNLLYVWSGTLGVAEALAAMPGVAAVRAPRVYQIEPPAQGSTLEGNPVWGILDTHAPDFWASFGMKGDGIVVANIDTGVDYTHDALYPNYKCGDGPHEDCWYDPGTVDCTGPGGGPCDTEYWGIYHGTHTMGTMAAKDDAALPYTVGMAPNAQWIACMGCPFGGCPDLDLNECADWILAPDGDPDNRPHVVNNSWGGWGGDAFYLGQVQAWRAAGIFPAFSAGNSGPSCASLGSPGDYQESFGSAAHDGGRAIADFSSRGPSAFGDVPHTKPNISAPGVDVISTQPGDGWASIGGTSMASPHTAGAVALLWSCNPTLVGQIEETFAILQDNADVPPAGDCGAPGTGLGNYTFGRGYLNAYQAGLLWCGETGTLAGHVEEAGTGAPIADVLVEAARQEGGVVTTSTNPDGDYSVTTIVGTYDVTASKYGYLPQTATSVAVITDTTVIQDFVLTPAQMYTVDGSVVDAMGGWPLYARIDIDGYPYSPVWTNPGTGDYSVDLMEGIEYTFHVTGWSAGYLPQDRAVGPLTGNQTENFSLEADLDACAAPGYEPQYLYMEDLEASDGGYMTHGSNSTWQWGTPINGPGSAHSGSNVWATSLAGYYVDNEDSYLESPNIDMSPYAGQGFALNWWQWLQTEWCCDFGEVQVSNNGGATWSTVYGPAYGDTDLDWAPKRILLDASYAVSNFRVRFHLWTDGSVTYPGWYVDDIALSGNCQLQTGGLVVGNVYDANTLASLPSAWVENDSGHQAMAVETPEDPTVDDAFYVLFSPDGSHTFTATHSVYQPDVALVQVTAGDSEVQDFYLGAGILSFSPPAIHAFVDMGASTMVSGSLSNNGVSEATFEFREQDRGFTPVLQKGVPAYVPPPASAVKAESLDGYGEANVQGTGVPAITQGDVLLDQTPNQENGIFSDTGCDLCGGQQTLAENFVLAEEAQVGQIVFWTGYFPGDVPIDPDQITVIFHQDAGGLPGAAVYTEADVAYERMQTGVVLFGVHEWMHTLTLATPVTLDPGNYWVEIYNNTGFGTDDFFWETGNLDPTNGLAGSAFAFETPGQFWNYDSYNNLSIQLVTGSVDVTWLSEAPVTGTVLALTSQQIDVTFDAGVPEVTQPGDYFANLNVANDTPYGSLQIPVTMTVVPPLTWGKLNGTITTLGYCDANPGPLPGAKVLIEGNTGMTWTVETDGAGYYQLWLDESHSPLSVTVMHPEHSGVMASGIVIYPQSATTVDLAMRWLEPCMSVTPPSIDLTVLRGTSETISVTLENAGARETLFVMLEKGGTEWPPSATGTGEWLYRAESGIETKSNRESAGLAYPKAYRWQPDTPSGLNILVYADDYIHWAPNTYLDQALQSLGLGYTAHYDGDWYGFEADLASGTWDLVLVGDDNWAPPDSVFTELNDYVVSGGMLVFHGWTVSWNPSHPLWATLGFTWKSDDWDPPDPVYWWEPDHPIFTNPESVPEIKTLDPWIYGTYGQYVEPLQGREAVAGYTTPGPDPNSAAMVLANDNRTVFKGFVDGHNSADRDADGLPDGVELWINLIDGIQSGFAADVPWLSEEPVTGTVSADSVTVVDITFTGIPSMPVGIYTATVLIKTDDPVNRSLALPVTMTLVSAPVCSFVTSSPDELGETTVFTNTTDEGMAVTNYAWDLGDGDGTATSTSLTYTYALPAEYTVVLTAENQYGAHSCTGMVAIEGVIARFDSNSPVVLGEPVVFTNTTVANPGIVRWFWTFGDGGLSDVQHPLHLFAKPGVYTVTLFAATVDRVIEEIRAPENVYDIYVSTVEVMSAPHYYIYLPIVSRE